MISLPGLLLCTQRHQLAGHTLAQFASHVSEGMIPNRFDDYTHEASYNTVDASLWFINACFEYVKATNDRKLFEEQLLPACKAIVKGYMGGTRFHIYMDADGLISSGDPSTQLTWMDAKCNGVVFTPRHGKAVEINALWHNALMLLGDTELAGKVAKSFVKTFWVNPFRGLLDVVHKDHIDNSIRPNQIFAVSLTHSPLSLDQQSASGGDRPPRTAHALWPCARFQKPTNNTSADTPAARSTATKPTTTAPSGPGSSARSSKPI